MENKTLKQRWHSLLYRCGNEKFPTYLDKTVCKDWKESFYSFQEWSYGFVFEGMELDKDIISPGNKVYCPEYCSYVPKWLNLVLGTTAAQRGQYLIGVSYKKPPKGMTNPLKKAYEARCMDMDGKKLWLGYHETEEIAHNHWKIAKLDVIEKAVARYTETSPNVDGRVLEGLDLRIETLRSAIEMNSPILIL